MSRKKASQLREFGGRLREARVHAGLSTPALARRARVGVGATYRAEHGAQEIGVLRAAALARALGVSLDVLLGLEVA